MNQPQNSTAPAQANHTGAPKEQLTVFDSICIIVGIIIGVGIYQTAPTVAGCMPNAGWTLAIWMIGGVLSLSGALCYAELASAYPKEGGDYVYLTRAYGRWVGFLFAWASLVIIRPGNIVLLIFPFATYLQTIWSPFEGSALAAHTQVVFSLSAVILLTAINILGVRQGKWTQNLLTVGKALGIVAIFVVALFAPARPVEVEPIKAFSVNGLNLALILILFSYGGWNEIAYVATEVKNPSRNLVRALVLGTLTVTVLYGLINVAFLHTLGHAQVAASKAVATDTVAAVFPSFASRAISALICVSALGSANGLIFAGSRIAYAMGVDHAAFRFLGNWNRRYETPAAALAFQGAIAVVLIIIAGSFNQVLLYTTAVWWTFLFGTGISVFILRAKDARLVRPYKVLGHPFTTLLFCASCAFLVYSAAVYDPKGTRIAFGVLLAGLPVYWISSRRRTAKR